MCKDNQVFKLCTCVPLKGLTKNARRARRKQAKALPIQDTTWLLQRFVQNIDANVRGMPAMPATQLNQELTNTYVVSQLNARNCFDFDYLPSQGDSLTLQNKSGAMSFIYGEQGWAIDDYDPFFTKLSEIAQGNMSCEDK
jgi:hypothetical protein